MPRAHVNGVDLYYQTAGAGERIVMTHGAWTDGRTWQAVTERLADRFEIVAWDRRGHSRSADGEGPGSVRQDAADLAGLIEHLGGGPVHLVGNSAGGCVVLNLLTLCPGLVASATVHEAVPLAVLQGESDPRVSQLVAQNRRHIERVNELISRGEHRHAARYFVEEVAVGPGAWDLFPPEMHQVLTSNAPTVVDDLRDSLDPDCIDVDALAVCGVPLLISWGTNGPGLESAAARKLAELLPVARSRAIEGAGHIPHRTHPGEYADLVADFVEENGGVSPRLDDPPGVLEEGASLQDALGTEAG